MTSVPSLLPDFERALGGRARVTLVLGLMIWRQWPGSSFRAIGILVGISMLLTGVTRLMMALEVRKLAAARGD
jgi:hypothetical protein